MTAKITVMSRMLGLILFSMLLLWEFVKGGGGGSGGDDKDWKNGNGGFPRLIIPSKKQRNRKQRNRETERKKKQRTENSPDLHAR